MRRAYAVELTIPDNAAFTALGALRSLGIACDDVRRADVFVFDADEEALDGLDRSVPELETIYNPNKHALRRCADRPAHGEVWVANDRNVTAASSGGPLRLAGRTLAGVNRMERYTSWRLRTAGADVPPAVLDEAVERLLCHPAFQKAIR